WLRLGGRSAPSDHQPGEQSPIRESVAFLRKHGQAFHKLRDPGIGRRSRRGLGQYRGSELQERVRAVLQPEYPAGDYAVDGDYGRLFRIEGNAPSSTNQSEPTLLHEHYHWHAITAVSNDCCQ